jgi:hypothetical protein
VDYTQAMSKTNLIILITFGLVVFGYFQLRKDPPKQPLEEVTQEEVENILPDKDSPIVETSLFTTAPNVDLEDVSGGNSTGQAWIVINDGKIYHQVIAQDLPELTDEYFYEGWLVREKPSPDFFSTGKMVFDEQSKVWILNYETTDDKSDYSKVVITLEPDDDNPAPAKHILE